MIEVPVRRTYPGSRAAWVDSRFRALVYAFLDRGLPLEIAMNAALALLSHLVRESGWGRAEWNYNVGNIKCSGGECHKLNDGKYYRSYKSLDEGVSDYVRLLENARYRHAMGYLITTSDGVGWYDRLMRSGYHPWSRDALEEFGSIQRSLRANGH